MAKSIKSKKSQGHPTCQVYLSIEAETSEQKSNTYAKQSLSQWSAIAVRYEKSKPTRTQVASGSDIASWWRWLDYAVKSRSSVTIWCDRSAMTLSLIGLWEECDQGRYIPEWIVTAAPPTIIRGKRGKQSMHFLDIANYWRSSLVDLVGSLGLELPPDLVEYRSESSIGQGAQKRAEVIRAAVESFQFWLADHNLGKIKYTASSQALSIWQQVSEGKAIYPHNHAPWSTIERSGYYGGWCNAFYLGEVKEPVCVLDVKAFYPSLMGAHLFPSKARFGVEKMTVSNLRENLARYGVIARVRIHSENEVYPVRADNQTRYCTGDFWTTLAGPELTYAADRDQIVEVRDSVIYDLDNLFESFVDRLWTVRKGLERSGDVAWRQVTKLVMNSLYGKFAQVQRGWDWASDEVCQDIFGLPGFRAGQLPESERPKHIPRWGSWYLFDGADQPLRKFRSIAGDIQEYYRGGEHPDSFVAIPAYVTSYGRVYLRNLLAMCPPESVYYMDTDSIHCSMECYEHLKSLGMVADHHLGKLSLKEKASSARYWNQKVYRLDDRCTIAGLPQKRATMKGEDWIYHVWESLNSIIERGPDGEIQMWERSFRVDGEYHAGRVKASGWTEPYHLTRESDPTIPF